MSTPSDIFRFLLHRLGVVGPARLRASEGTGASKIIQGTGATFLFVLTTLLLIPGTALAAQETPEVSSIEDTTAAVATPSTKALLYGVLNPASAGEEGTYKFLYKASKTKVCTGGSETTEGMSLTRERQELPAEPISGLTPGTEYAVCLRVENNAKTKSATSTAVTFTTPLHPETPEKLEAKPIAATAATLNGVLNPAKAGDPGTYEFFYQQSKTECQGAHQQTASGAETGAKGEPVEAKVAGLLPHKPYTFCLLAKNEAGEESTLSAPEAFTTPAASPTIEEQFTTDVASTSTTLNARVNPQGAETSYTFEYAPAGGEFKPVLESNGKGGGSVGEGAAPVPVEVHVQEGLTPATAYEFRVVVSNSVQQNVAGPPVAFTTQQAVGAFALPDNRQYEMVTPPQKEGALFGSSLGQETGVAEGGSCGCEESFSLENPDIDVVVEASAAGNGIVDGADEPVEAEPQAHGYANGVSVLSTRGPSGWSSQVLPTPHDEATTPSLFGNGSEYRLFSEDLSRGALQQFGNFTPLAPEAVESTPYLRANYLNDNVSARCEQPDLSQSSCFQALVTRADTQAGVVFGDTVSGECSFYDCGPHLVGATPDLSHVILASRERLTATPISVTYVPAGYFENPALYEWYGGQLRLLNILPGAQVGDTNLQLAYGNKRHVMSDNGERVLLQNGGHSAPALYLRDVAKGETILLNATEPDCGTCSGGGEGAQYMTANSEGSRIFFLDTSKLTSDSHGGSADLYECEIVEVAGKLQCSLSDLTPETGGEAANVEMVLGASEDGSYVYFVAGGALATGATTQGCNFPIEGEEPLPCNLYVHHDGVTTFIAALSGEDGFFFKREANSAEQAYTNVRARVSPNGHWLAFMSARDLTGYDTHDAINGLPDEEVYLYGASANTLACASCDPTGARPVGLSTQKTGNYHYQIASIVPGWDGFEAGEVSGIDQIYQPRYLSDEGRLFFDSKDALVPLDVNGAVDVYEYEPEGAPAGEHACSSATRSGSEVFKPAHGFEVEGGKGEEGAGCVALISSGTSSEESSFLDASAGDGEGEHGEAGSEAGRNVFFLTAAKLAPQDFDNALDIYDARECTAASPCPPAQAEQPPACTTEASCKASPTPQPSIYGPPPSATFNGPGNIAAPAPPQKVTKKTVKCKQSFVRNKKDKCVKRPKKKKTKARKAGNNRRTK